MSGNSNHDLLTNKLRALTEVAEVLASRVDLPQLLQSVLDKVIEIVDPAEFGAIMLWDQTSRVFRPRAATGPPLSNLKPLFEHGMQDGESITGRVFAAQKAQLLSTPATVTEAMGDIKPATRDAMDHIYGKGKLPLGVLTAPLSAGEFRYGVLVLETLKGPDFFSNSDISFVQTLADLIALEIDRSRLDVAAESIRESEEMDRIRAELMATFSHELRTPLATIKGYSTALLLPDVKWPEEKRREFLQLIEDECDNLEGMIADILDSSLIDVGHLYVEFQPVRLQLLAQEVAREMERTSDIHRFAMDFPQDFPIVDADPRRIKQVFRNILDNAIKYAPNKGLVVIRGEIRPHDVVISIADQGVGISPEDLIPLFDKYFRVKAPTGYHVAGTGLGLPVSRAIVEAHGGHIWAESKIDEGTTLYFSIPTEREAVDGATKAAGRT